MYHKVDGTQLLRITRTIGKDGKKSYLQERWEAGAWCWGGVKPAPLYAAPRLASAPPGSSVFLVEGEKCADRLIDGGLLATTAPGGAQKVDKVDLDYLELLLSLGSVGLPDNDLPGYRHILQFGRILRDELAIDIKVLLLPGLGEGHDVFDWLQNRLTKELLALVPSAMTFHEFESRFDDLTMQWTASKPQLELLGDPGPNEWDATPVEYPRVEFVEDRVDAEPEPEPEEPQEIPWPAPIAREAYHGIIGEITRTIEPHTESDAVAILIQTLVMAGHLIGDGPHVPVERTKHRTNEYALLVGKTGKARKGTSWDNVYAVASAAMGVGPEGIQIIGGLGSGEALTSAVQDRPEDKQSTVSEVSNRKRQLILEVEFAHVLKVQGREGSTLSPIMRTGWDGGPISNRTKFTSVTATGHHLSLIGHITGKELRDLTKGVEIANGNANRFIHVAVKRSQFLPEGGALTDQDVVNLGRKLRACIERAKQLGQVPVIRDQEAKWLWGQIYRDLSEGLPGLSGSLLARGEAHVVRLSLLYALLDGSSMVRKEHLLAALAVWDYSVASVRYFFGDRLGNPLADNILSELRARQAGLTRTEISKLLHGNKSSSDIGRALQFLEEQGVARKQKQRDQGQKRPAEVWIAENDHSMIYLQPAKDSLKLIPAGLATYESESANLFETEASAMDITAETGVI
ncbi:DUF3987 domain-containing protein [bacterium]|nr:DUF3987 domain-containing protein [bacterium]